MVYDRPPVAIVGRKSRGIGADPKSLEGRKFGAPAADAAFAQWPIFRAVNNLDEKTMKFENVGFPVREPMLASGEVDAVFGFSMSSYINLKSRGVPVDDIVLMLMSDHGVELYGNVVMVNPAFAKEKPEGAQLRGRSRVERLKLVIDQNILTPWVKQNGWGGIDSARFSRAIDQIGLTFAYKAKPKTEDIFVDAYLPPAADRKPN